MGTHLRYTSGRDTYEENHAVAVVATDVYDSFVEDPQTKSERPDNHSYNSKWLASNICIRDVFC